MLVSPVNEYLSTPALKTQNPCVVPAKAGTHTPRPVNEARGVTAS
jgi:hypothetical protein